MVLKGGKGGVEGCIHRRVMLYLQYLCVVSAYKGAEHTLPSMMLLLGAYSYWEHTLTGSILCIVQ